MNYLIDPKIEVILRQTILPDVERRGRIDFDIYHIQAVVHWMKHLVQETTLDSKVMVTTAYAHDWGYVGLFDGIDSSDFAEIKKRKPLHMERGATLIHELLTTKLSSYFTSQEIERIIHLVSVHDRVEDLKEEDELLIMEADTLGMLDVDRVKPTFSKIDNDHFIQKEIQERRVPRFIHLHAKNNVDELIEKRIRYYLDK